MICSFSKTPCWRMVATRHPGEDVFQGITDFGEWEELFEIESLTNERLRTLAAIPKERRAYGPGSAYIMAPFAYRAPGRFGDGSFGVLYAGLDQPTALAEAGHHRARFLEATHNPKETAEYQMLSLKFTGDLEDIRPLVQSELYAPDPDQYPSAQRFAAQIQARGGDGIVYASVRRLGGECIAGFRPDRFSDCHPVKMIQLFWDGVRLMSPGGSLA